MGKAKKFSNPKSTDTAQAVSDKIYDEAEFSLDIKAQLASEFEEIEKEQIQPGELRIDNFVLYPDKLTLEYRGNPEDLTFTEWQKMGSYLHQHQSAIQWMLGDWALMAEAHLDEWISEDDEQWQEIKAKLTSDADIPNGKYLWLAMHTDYSYSSLTKFKHYAEMFPVFRRRKTLTYSHHVEVARLDDPSAQDSMLDAAEPAENDSKARLSVRDLRKLIEATYSLSAGSDDNHTDQIPFQSDIEKIRQFTGSKQFQKLSKKQRQALYNELQSILLQMEEAGV